MPLDQRVELANAQFFFQSRRFATKGSASMKIALAQVNPVIGDFETNYQRIRARAEEARSRSCDLVIFPELVLSGYPPRDLLDKTDFVDANLRCLGRMLETIRGIGVICGYVEPNKTRQGRALFNTAVLFEDGHVLQRVHKRLLPTYDVFDETRYFEPGSDCRLITYRGRRLGLTICEDVWNDKDIFDRRIYPVDPVQEMAGQGADLIVNVSASPFHHGKIEFRHRLHGSTAGKYNVPFVFVNQVGGNDSLLFDGVSTAYDRNGNLVARARDFEEDLVVLDTESWQGDIRKAPESKEEAVLKALVMGTRDYVTKCGFSKAVIGLSGGIDSALTAAIAARALGAENVYTVFMPSRYTAQDNYEDTRQLAQNLNLSLETVPIDAIFDAFRNQLQAALKTEEHGVTEQNIQARTRGTILMAVSNERRCLLLSTGNKSELAVGYCTLYGDMNGGLAVISDVPKTMVYDLAEEINRNRERIPRRILEKAPSAELAPDQRDEDDLPPYSVLDRILSAYIEESKSVSELLSLGYEHSLVEAVVTRVDRNEYKRHQSPPGLKVTSKAFGFGRRYPIAQRFVPSYVQARVPTGGDSSFAPLGGEDP